MAILTSFIAKFKTVLLIKSAVSLSQPNSVIFSSIVNCKVVFVFSILKLDNLSKFIPKVEQKSLPVQT